ncbi:MAG: UDP-N-acetylglucosamine 2-epimerase (non-hydrolyzing) [Smithella sp.]|jgi:UDP-N-acetylglucosamine 2-epimerase (non-hydrolysing)
MNTYSKKLIHLVAAARPNFMKIAPLYHALVKDTWASPAIIHTGQHYDLNMSDAFFHDLDLPKPHIYLNVGSGTHAEQTGKVMMAYEKILLDVRPDLVVVAGDVNSTMAATIAAIKLGIKVAHLEAGLRSFDRTMPEEINRILTDAIADLLWTPSPDADENLLREGIAQSKIQMVGNIMIDSLEMLRSSIEKEPIYSKFGLNQHSYGIVTLHRPANVDSPEILEKLCRSLSNIAEKIPIVFPIHPRTMKNLQNYGLINILKEEPNLHLTEPMNYISFMNLIFNCAFAITDSGGIQEETTYLGIPCLTIRPNTERPITITQGTNRLCKIDEIQYLVNSILEKNPPKKNAPLFWDGKTADRVVSSIKQYLFS